MTSNTLLLIYLNDHRGGSVAGIELAKRCAANNEGTALADYLGEFVSEIEEDARLIDRLIVDLGGRLNPFKAAFGWVAEKVGRAKFNGQLTGYSDLSRVLELEGLIMGVTGREQLLKSLRHIASVLPELDVDFDELIERAQRQQDRLEDLRLTAVSTAFRDGGAPHKTPSAYADAANN